MTELFIDTEHKHLVAASPPGHILPPELAAEEQPIDLILSVMTGEAYYELLAASKTGDAEQVKATLRAYISMLEELYFRLR